MLEMVTEQGYTGAGGTMGRTVSTEEKKQWLYRAWNMRRELEALEDAKAMQFERATSITPKYNGQSGSGSKNPHKMDGYSTISILAEAKRKEFEQIRNETTRVIQSMKDQNERAVLIQRYVNFRSWEDIAKCVHYSERKTFNIHREGLKNIRITRRMIDKMEEEKMCSEMQLRQ